MGPGHVHAERADARRLGAALALIVGLMVAEVVAGIVASSLALLSDAGHMLTDAVALALALAALRLAQWPPAGSFTYGMRRAEILSAQVNGITLLLLGGLVVYEGIRRLIDPPDVEGTLVLVVAVVGIGVNLLAARLLAGAERRSLNIEGAFLHIVTDLFAFLATAVAGAVILIWGFERADGIASQPGVVEVHDLHVWEVTTGLPAVSAHIIVGQGDDCHEARWNAARLLADRFGIEHSTLQVEHEPGDELLQIEPH